MRKCSSKTVRLLCVTTFDSYSSSSESDGNLASNKSGSASSWFSFLSKSLAGLELKILANYRKWKKLKKWKTLKTRLLSKN